MAVLVTFVIPVAHPLNVADPEHARDMLVSTLRSVAAQTKSSWRCLVVADHGAVLPSLPEKCEAVLVDLPPNPVSRGAGHGIEEVREAVRLDKGRRLLSGMLRARDSRYFMIVDHDDFVSRHLVEHVAAHDGENGWRIHKGYFWTEESHFLFAVEDFGESCGTSLIVRSDLYRLPDRVDQADEGYVKSMIGSHKFIADALARAGTPLAPLPFAGAVYRVGSANQHSHATPCWRRFLINRHALTHPANLLRNLRRLRIVTRALREEFMGIGNREGRA